MRCSQPTYSLAHSRPSSIPPTRRYLLSILTFVSKCTGVAEQEFEDLIVEAGLSQVVYNLPHPPSRMPVDSPAPTAGAGTEAGSPPGGNAAGEARGRSGRGAGGRGAGTGGVLRQHVAPLGKIPNSRPSPGATVVGGALSPSPTPGAGPGGYGAAGDDAGEGGDGHVGGGPSTGGAPSSPELGASPARKGRTPNPYSEEAQRQALANAVFNAELTPGEMGAAAMGAAADMISATSVF